MGIQVSSDSSSVVMTQSGVVASETSAYVVMPQPGTIVSETSAYIVYMPVSLVTGGITGSGSSVPIVFGFVSLVFTTKQITDNDATIIVRRGPGYDLPGKPYALSPTTWAPGLDESEIAFSTDESRIFIGSDPTRNLPQANRKSYPYRNIEILGELSTGAFARMHGSLTRSEDNNSYYTSNLMMGSGLNVMISGSPFILATSGQMFSTILEYSIFENGDSIRQGELQITSHDTSSNPEVIDCYDTPRTEFFNPLVFNFKVNQAFDTMGFKFSAVRNLGVVYLQYTSNIPGNTILCFKCSSPMMIPFGGGQQSSITEHDDTLVSSAHI